MSEVGDGEPPRERRQDPGPSGQEFREALENARVRNVLGGGILFLTFVLAVLAVVNALDASDTAEEIRVAVIEVCEVNREGQVFSLEQELLNLRATDRSLFPDIPRDRWRELVSTRAAGYREQMRVLAPERCADEFAEAAQ